MNQKSIGEQIRYHRQKQGLTQQELAKSIGVTWEMISRYERGVSSSLGKIEALAKALDLDPIEILQKSYNPNFLREGGGNRIPLFTAPPQNKDFRKGATQYFYSAPDWIMEMDKDSFLIDPYIVSIKTVQLRDKGPIYISPSTKPELEDMVLFYKEKQLTIDKYKNIAAGEQVVGLIMAQEFRYK